MKLFVQILSLISAYGIERNVAIFRISAWFEFDAISEKNTGFLYLIICVPKSNLKLKRVLEINITRELLALMKIILTMKKMRRHYSFMIYTTGLFY